jgi:hypothetical protein
VKVKANIKAGSDNGNGSSSTFFFGGIGIINSGGQNNGTGVGISFIFG